MDGALLVNACVTVRRDGPQNLLVEGAYGSAYLGVRKLLYEQFQQV